ncbi:uncharacterized protein [Globicephala melas]|uniref:uncharacterized protein isoform X1 n=2 Tax=Globicephala melas TaxID=9731 RepID=UPI00293D4F94|nr:uncharacterized protein LOC115845916 isoform X1 [Globicephala melas]
MWDPSRPGHEPVSPKSTGGLSTTAPPGKPICVFLIPPNSPFLQDDRTGLAHVQGLLALRLHQSMILNQRTNLNLSPPCLRIRCKHFRIADKYHPTLALPLVSLSSFHSSTYSLHSRDEETVLRDVKRRGRITQLIGDKFGICSLSSGANTKQNKIKRSPNTKQLSPRPESIRKDPKELSNPRGRSYLSGEVLTAETLEISGSGILLSELSIKVQPQILGALNKNYQQAVLPVCTLLKGRAYVNK